MPIGGQERKLIDTLEREKAIWTRSAHLHAGQRQASTRRINRPDTRKRLTKCPGLNNE